MSKSIYSKNISSYNHQFIPDSKGNIVSNGFVDDQMDASGNASNNMMLNKFVKRRSNAREHKRDSEIKIDPFNIDVETISNFLEYHEVQFLPEDVCYIFRDMGIDGTKVSINQFEKFLDSQIWG